MCAPIFCDFLQAVAPRRGDIVGVVPQHVVAERSGRRWRRRARRPPRPSARLRNWCRPPGTGRGGRTRIAHGCLTTLHQSVGYLPEAARFITTWATASWPSTDLAARFEIDRGREAVGLLVERRVGRELVDQRVERPAALVEPRRLRRDRRVELERHRLRRLRLEDVAGGGRDRGRRATTGFASVEAALAARLEVEADAEKSGRGLRVRARTDAEHGNSHESRRNAAAEQSLPLCFLPLLAGGPLEALNSALLIVQRGMPVLPLEPGV